jgi:hypothetical protein
VLLKEIVMKLRSAVLLVAAIAAAGCNGSVSENTYGSAKPLWPDLANQSLFPKSAPPADVVWHFNGRHLSPEDAVLMTTAQGVINSEIPQLYVSVTKPGGTEANNEDLQADHEKRWLDWLVSEGYIKSSQKLETLEDVLEKWNIKKAVIIDPELPASLNIATMLAGIKGVPAAYPEVAEKYGLEPEMDLRGKFKSNVEAYNWMFDNYWDQMDHSVVAWLGSVPKLAHLRDYLAAKKIFTLWVTGRDDGNPANSSAEQELKMAEQLLTRMPVNIPVIGFPWCGNNMGVNEQTGVRVISRSGKFHVPMDWKANMSVWAGLSARKDSYRQKPMRDIKLENDKIYVSFVISDGDNLNTWIDFFPKYWEHESHGKIPVGWTMGPGLVDLQGPVIDYYYSGLTELDSIGSAVTGVGYMYAGLYGHNYAPRYRGQIWQGYQYLTEKYMRKLDMNWVHIFRVVPVNELPYRQFTDMPVVDSVFSDYGGSVDYPDSHYMIDDKPVFHCIKLPGDPEARVRELMKKMDGIRPAFVHMFLSNWGWNFDDITKLARELPDEVIIVAHPVNE